MRKGRTGAGRGGRGRTGRLVWLGLLGGLIGCGAGGGATPGAAPSAPVRPRPPLPAYVILISADGFRHDYLDRPLAANLRALAARGVRADGLVPVFPSKTFPNHYAIVTGLYPEQHGIVANDFHDPDLGADFAVRDRSAVRDARWWLGEPIWVTAERQGVRTAPFFWPGSEAPIGGAPPTYALPYDGSMPHAARIDTVLALLDLPPERRPRLLTMYFSDTDDAGHAHGPASVEIDSAIARVDAAIGRLVRGLEQRGLTDSVALVVVSDHGMAALDSSRVIRIGDPGGRAFGWSPVLGVWPAESVGADRVVERLRAASRALTVYRRDETPAAWHYRASPRVPPVVALAAEGWTIVRPDAEAGWRPRGGNHGFDPALRSQWGILVAAGPGLRRGVRLPALRNVHVHPLLGHLLGVRVPRSEGSLDSVRAALAR